MATTTKKPTKPAEMVVDCPMCGGKRDRLAFVAAGHCDNADAPVGAHLHRSCSTCSYGTCEHVMGKG